MLSRIVLSIAAVVASVGLLLYGMGSAYSPQDDGLMSLGLGLGIAGLVGVVIGIGWYRMTENAEEAEAQRKYGNRR